jgi:hypothetical protein
MEIGLIEVGLIEVGLPVVPLLPTRTGNRFAKANEDRSGFELRPH